MGRKTVPQRVHGHGFGEAGGIAGEMAGELHAADAEVLIGFAAGEKPGSPGPFGFPRGAQERQKPGREHHQTFLAPLALGDAQRHALGIDIVRAQSHDLKDAQTGGIGRTQDGTRLEVRCRLEKPADFLDTENNRQFLWPLLEGQPGQDPIAFQRHRVQKAQGGNNDVEVGTGDLLRDERPEVLADLLRPEIGRRAVEMPRKPGDGIERVPLRIGRQVADLHVLDHAMAKRAHGRAPGWWKRRDRRPPSCRTINVAGSGSGAPDPKSLRHQPESAVPELPSPGPSLLDQR